MQLDSVGTGISSVQVARRPTFLRCTKERAAYSRPWVAPDALLVSGDRDNTDRGRSGRDRDAPDIRGAPNLHCANRADRKLGHNRLALERRRAAGTRRPDV